MYKGNMYEFAERVVAYVEKTFGVKFSLEMGNEYERSGPIKRRIENKYKSPPGEWVETGRRQLMIWHYKRDSSMYGMGKTLTDMEDFEEQLYTFINEALNRK
jgi:hypothetical protein